MIPYLHLGPLNLPTFGLMVATGLLAASYILQADFRRRAIHADAFLVIGLAGFLEALRRFCSWVGAKKFRRLLFLMRAAQQPAWVTPSAESVACSAAMATMASPPSFPGA